jgi:arsenate reductase
MRYDDDWMTQTDRLRQHRPETILFLCVANSARSQMAETIGRALAPEGVRILSAGSRPASIVHPLVMDVLDEIDLDASDQRPKGIDTIALEEVDAVVTLCAEEVCPTLPVRVPHIHWPLPDPASTDDDPDEALDGFRSVRDELRRRIARLFQADPGR